MTTVATCEVGPLPSALVADDEKYARARSVRVPDNPWFKFGEVVGDRRKAQWLTDFMQSVVDNPELYLEVRAAAEIRGESFADALAWGVREYRNRGK